MNRIDNENGRGAAGGSEHIVFVTETPKAGEAKPAATKSGDWHSGGGIGTRVGDKTTRK